MNTSQDAVPWAPLNARGDHACLSDRLPGRIADFPLRRAALQAGLAWALLIASPAVGQAEGAVVLSGSDDFMSLSLEQLTAIDVDLVFGASKHEQKTTEAPSSVTIVTRQSLEAREHRTLAGILDGVRGVYTNYDGAYRTVGVRGFNRPGDFGGRILMTIEGHRLNDGIYDTAASGMDFMLDVDLIERVEVIRGPGSSLYGNNAFFGVVNVIPRSGESIGGTEVALAAADLGTYTGRVSYGRKFDSGLDVLVSGTWFGSDGHEHLAFPEFEADGLDREQAPSGYVRMTQGGFTLQGGFVRRRKDWPMAAYDTVPGSRDPRLFSVDERAFVSLDYRHELAEHWLVNARTYFDHYRFDGDYPYDYDEDPSTTPDINRDFALARTGGMEIAVNTTFIPRHQITLGADWRHDFELTQKNWDVGSEDTYVDSRERADTVGVFIQDEWKLQENLVFNAGIRHDHHAAYGGRVDPRAALIYHPRADTAWKLLYGQAFRAPNAYERSYESYTNRSNTELSPETIRSYELAWERSFSEHWRASVSGFWNDIRDLVELTLDTGDDPDSPEDDLFTFSNVGAVESRGVELEVERRLRGGVQAVASYAFADTRDRESRGRLTNSPRHMGKLGVTLPFWEEKLLMGLEVQGMSSRLTVTGNESGAYAIANATLFSRKLINGWELATSVFNLFNTTYRDPVSEDFSYTGPISGEAVALDTNRRDGRTFRVKLVSRF